ncbi:hypothetical protein CL622_04200 [archaeon]|nr:hypothetical protein [archaeon]
MESLLTIVDPDLDCDILVSQDGSKIATGKSSGGGKIWDAITGEMLWKIDDSHCLMGCTLSFDGTKLLKEFNDDKIQLWNICPSTLLHTFEDISIEVPPVIFPDGNRIAYTDNGNNSKIIDINQKKVLHLFVGHQESIHYLALTPDSKIMISSGYDFTVRAWDTDSGEMMYSIENEMACSEIVANISGNGDILIVCLHDDSVFNIFDIYDGTLLHTFQSTIGVDTTYPSYDCNTIGVYSVLAEKVCVWDDDTDDFLSNEINVSNSYSYPILFDGSILCCGYMDGKISFWDIRTGILLYSFQGYDSGSAVIGTYSLSNDRMVSVSLDNIVKVWDISDLVSGDDEYVKGKMN